ncbi:SET domain-containing protein [Brevibacillus choshinensis]|uniref:SET domain-containing protein n=1 Tax=Brevibacillus choshinensis TaxID=54911 RepID=UPI002E1C2867|nr:SET domain-containing protein [Brevibacillus choshinensis]MED4782038.1 SET domain-containing protein [Brevibacillus choshinensis]
MLRIDYIKGKGRGVIAAKDFIKGEIIERSPVIVIPYHELMYILKTILINYIFSWESNQSAIALGYGSLYNHSHHPNATYFTRIKDMCIEFQALENIQEGQEITIDYGWHPNGI